MPIALTSPTGVHPMPGESRCAKSKPLDTLGQIALGDNIQDDFQALENWTAYADYRKNKNGECAKIESEHQRTVDLVRAGIEAQHRPSPLGAVEGGGSDHAAQRELDIVTEVLEADRAERTQAALEALDTQFTQAHEAKFNANTVSGAWKTPYRMRFDNMSRLLLGKVAASARSLLKHNEKTAPQSGQQAQFHATRLAGKRQILKASLRDSDQLRGGAGAPEGSRESARS